MDVNPTLFFFPVHYYFDYLYVLLLLCTLLWSFSVLVLHSVPNPSGGMASLQWDLQGGAARLDQEVTHGDVLCGHDIAGVDGSPKDHQARFSTSGSISIPTLSAIYVPFYVT